jgi:serine/threonine protein kinase
MPTSSCASKVPSPRSNLNPHRKADTLLFIHKREVRTIKERRSGAAGSRLEEGCSQLAKETEDKEGGRGPVSRTPSRAARPPLRSQAPVVKSSARPLASWRPSARLEPVERYGRFEILGRIGRGGMAEILLARERSLAGGSRHLVIKRVLPEVRDFDELLHMFLDESRVVMDLSHPNLCQIYEVGEQEGTWFIAMEWVNGVTLHQLLRRALETDQLDYAVLARVIAQCADALHYAHTARDAEGQLMQLVHRDVSPHNLMIAYDGRVKLLDFGIAKSSVTTHRTEAGVVKGKICYMAPEQWLSEPLDARTDLFSLGATLYEALSGRVAFKRENQHEVMKAALAGDVAKLPEIAPRTPAALVAIVERALATAPADRYQSARALSEALEAFIASTRESVSAARISEYTRRLFFSEVQLGPVLERSLRGAQLMQAEGLFLPPLPASLRALVERGVERGADGAPGRRTLPTPFEGSAPPPAFVLDERPWPEEGAFDHAALTEPARVRSSAFDAILDAVAAESPSNAPTSPSIVPSLTRAVRTNGLTSLRTGGEVEIARPLARTLSMKVGRSARHAVLGTVLALAAVLPLYLGTRAWLEQEPATLAQRVLDETADHHDPRAAPLFTLLPAGAPAAMHEPSDGETRAVASPRPYGGRLSINTRPWSTVYLGKRLLGSTPLADVPVPRGPLNLKLVDRDGKVHVRRVPVSNAESRAVHFEF